MSCLHIFYNVQEENYKTAFLSLSALQEEAVLKNPTQFHPKNNQQSLLCAREVKKKKSKIICIFLEGNAVKDNIVFEIPASPHFIFSSTPPIVVKYQNTLTRQSAFTMGHLFSV